jgi:hypothetical protein
VWSSTRRVPVSGRCVGHDPTAVSGRTSPAGAVTTRSGAGVAMVSGLPRPTGLVASHSSDPAQHPTSDTTRVRKALQIASRSRMITAFQRNFGHFGHRALSLTTPAVLGWTMLSHSKSRPGIALQPRTTWPGGRVRGQAGNR